MDSQTLGKNNLGYTLTYFFKKFYDWFFQKLRNRDRRKELMEQDPYIYK